MKTAIITYQIPHLKTAQILERLASRKSAGEIDVFAIPFRPFKARDVLFKHRPDQHTEIETPELCARHGFGYAPVASDAEIPGGYDYYVITGAGILSPDCVRGKKIVNSHPGAIPAVRGLDAFKWAIHDMQPLANTLHYIDEAVDMGELITIEPTPVYADDSLESLAGRHYDLEIALLARFDDFIGRGPYISDYPEREATRRMPAAAEQEMMARFNAYKDRFAVDKKKEGTHG